MEIFVILTLIFFVIFLSTLVIVGYKYIRFLLRRNFYIVENVENLRDLFIEYEANLYEFTRNPVVQTELNYKKVAENVGQIKQIFQTFEEFYQELPEKKEAEDA
jgi:hypothetical protein